MGQRKQKEKTENRRIQVDGESTHLRERYIEYSLSAEYSEPNVHGLSSKILNMTVENEVIVSHADGVNAGLLHVRLPENWQEDTIQQKHAGFELIFVANGSYTARIGEECCPFTQYDVLLMNPNCKNMIADTKNLIAIVVTVSREYLAQYGLLRELKEFLSYKSCYDTAYTDMEYTVFRGKNENGTLQAAEGTDNISISRKEDVRALLYQLHDEMRKKAVGYDLVVPGLLKRLLDGLGNPCLYEWHTERENVLLDEDLAEQIKLYLDDVKRKVTMEELTEQFHYNRNHLAKIFTDHVGWQIRDYNRDVCMKEATRLLEETDFSVSAVAEKVGYLSRAQFYRNFQAYFGCLPSEIIKKI